MRHLRRINVLKIEQVLSDDQVRIFLLTFHVLKDQRHFQVGARMV